MQDFQSVKVDRDERQKEVQSIFDQAQLDFQQGKRAEDIEELQSDIVIVDNYESGEESQI